MTLQLPLPWHLQCATFALTLPHARPHRAALKYKIYLPLLDLRMCPLSQPSNIDLNPQAPDKFPGSVLKSYAVCARPSGQASHHVLMAAVEHMVAAAAVEHRVAATAVEHRVAATAVEHRVAATAVEHGVVATAVECVVTAAAVEHMVAAAAVEQ